jgi:predicted GNAT superfamily acetyltransferase
MVTAHMIRETARGPATASPPASPPSAALVVRRVETLDELQECVAIQEETWGVGFSERVPSSILLVATKIGGVVAGAFAPSGRMLGFVFGLTGVTDGELVHWSDLLAVRAEARGMRIGEQLKRHQRDLVRGMGVRLMRWTFDPLVARNAYLNLVRLGARATEYVPNMYGGSTGSPLHGGLDTDRLVATWDLGDGDGRAAERPRPAAVVNPPDGDGTPVVGELPDAHAVRIAVPHDLLAVAPERRAAWRATTRAAFTCYLGRGYEVTGFQRGDGGELPYYELARVQAGGAR